jgi:hypothetical protein
MKKKKKMTAIFGKIKAMKKQLILCTFCLVTGQTMSQTPALNNAFAQAEEQYNAKNYDDAITKLNAYDKISGASKEKSQLFRIQMYREIALKDQTKKADYDKSVEELETMFANGKNVNAEDLYRVLKEQQQFSTDAAKQTKEVLSSDIVDISIDGIKIGMNVEEIPAQTAANFDWSQGIKGAASEQLNYVPLFFSPKTVSTGSYFNFKLIGIQSLVADDRTRRVINVTKIVESDKYKEKDKTGLSTYNQMVEALKTKYGANNVKENPLTSNTSKIKGMEFKTETISANLLSKSVNYFITYTITNDKYSIFETMHIADYYKR